MDFSGIEKLSFVDWDNKIVTTLFTRGCNFRCPFCHNGFLVVGEDKNTIPFEEILNFLLTRKKFIDGVVISGGEPTLMNDLPEKIKILKDNDFKIKLDTNGTNFEILKYLIDNKLIDYVAMDIKNSFEKYPETCGKDKLDLENIKKSISYLKENHIDYEFRMTIVKEFHSLEDMDKIGKIVCGSPIFFLQHFKNSDGCIKQGLHEIPLEEANKFKEILEKYTKVKLRGY